MVKDGVLHITPRLSVPQREIELTYVRSSGPGGQNVNKVASKAVLRFSVRDSPSLPAAMRQRALAKLSSRLTSAGELVLSSASHREQSRNRDAVVARFCKILAEAVKAPKRRVPTRPGRAATERRMTEKRARGRRKRERSRPGDDGD